jgi:hypothetical protein
MKHVENHKKIVYLMSDRDDTEEIGNGINYINTTDVCTTTAENSARE